jgi:hypothetical protein
MAGAAVFVMASASGVSAAGKAEAVPTFAKDIAPILFDNCVTCHRPDQVAPMSLLSYEEARPWGRAIKEKVLSREMPPWFADRRFGKFRNERGLTQAEIDTIAAWVDGGAPKGDEADMPEAPEFESDWSHPEGDAPDYVLKMPIEFEMPAEGEAPNFNVYTRVPFEEDRFMQAIEMRPGNRALVHHAGAFTRDLPAGFTVGRGEAYTNGPIIEDGALVPVQAAEGATAAEFNFDPEEREAERQLAGQQAPTRDVFDVAGTSKLVSYVPGRGYEEHRPGVGKKVEAGDDKLIYFQMHYQATGQPESDRSELGFWFQKVPVTHEVLSVRVGETHVVEGQELVAERGRAQIPVIPAYDGDWAITGITAFEDDVTLYAMSPHMHLRGKDTTYVVTYPDGREEIVLSVPKYDFNWQLNYELEQPLKIPAGSTIKTVGHFDNSIRNRYNPAPDKEVYWAEQSWDEMYNGFIFYSIDKLDLTKRKPATE